MTLWGLALFGLALRLPGMFHDFWFDEVWSYLLVQEFVSSPSDILTRLHVDNNHPLNSAWLYLLGHQRAWSVYRVPSLVCGVASVMMAGRIMARRGRAHAVAAMVVTGCSYPLIVYSSEARGYAAMVFFLLLAIDAHEGYVETRAWSGLVTFWVAAVLGLTAHLTFIHAYAALLLWSIADSRRQGPRHLDGLWGVAGLHGVPLLFLVWLYRVFIGHLQVAGAEPAGLCSVMAETIGVMLGLPGGGAWSWFGALMLGCLLVVGLWIAGRSNPAISIFFFSGILLVPGLTVLAELRTAAMDPRFFPRYFLVSITLCLLLMAWTAGEGFRRAGWWRVACVGLMGLYVTGNLWYTARFVVDGRGHYREAVQEMARQTLGPEIRVTSNSDFRTSRLLAFYRQYLPPGTRMTFYPRGAAGLDRADWRIMEDVEPQASTPEVIDDGRGGRLRRVTRFPFRGLSGAQWTLYRRTDAQRAPVAERTPR